MFDNKANFLQSRLSKLKNRHTYRQLPQHKNQLIDFSSNDYLGMARSERFWKRTEQYAQHFKQNGSTGSRLISGNFEQTEALEHQIAHFHHAEAALLFNSGYDANLGLFSCIARAGDTIISDALIHASIIDGIRLSKANRMIFKHNDVSDLGCCLKKAEGNIFIAVESLYSMDGDEGRLLELLNIAEKYGANLIVDEAHGTGIYGEQGEGLVCKLGLQDRVFARVHTFGKALGCHGAVVIGRAELKAYLINFARSFIFTTALPPHALAAIRASYSLFPGMKKERKMLFSFIKEFKKRFKTPSSEHSPIQSILVGNAVHALDLAKTLEKKDIYAKAIVHPTVAIGSERLRICLHAFNTKRELQQLLELLSQATLQAETRSL